MANEQTSHQKSPPPMDIRNLRCITKAEAGGLATFYHAERVRYGKHESYTAMPVARPRRRNWINGVYGEIEKLTHDDTPKRSVTNGLPYDIPKRSSYGFNSQEFDTKTLSTSDVQYPKTVKKIDLVMDAPEAPQVRDLLRSLDCTTISPVRK
ncbi:hypothetical protein EVAR_92365_1 [Eumeta japonica]|uniref:Uncharacterized protein n=1 Tax=Eumeta variegata TaxID=151549 RepID=A0A4C1TIQ8_EUMVA|nr:hypothetical protein EVAR_92365_1 [Eumeta japonica]